MCALDSRTWCAAATCLRNLLCAHDCWVIRFVCVQDFTLAGVFNATNECNAALNPLLRLFKTTRKTSTVPLFELSAPPVPYLNWDLSSPATACGPEWETSLD